MKKKTVKKFASKLDGAGSIISQTVNPNRPQTTPINQGDVSQSFTSIVQNALNVLVNSDTGYRNNHLMSVQMMRDPAIMQPVQRRILSVASIPWEIQGSNEDVKKRATYLINKSSRLTDFYRMLGWGIWRGTGSAELFWKQDPNTYEFYVDKFRMINGDKFMFDKWGSPRILDREHQFGGRELSQDELSRICIHTYEQDDGDFYDGFQADMIYRGRGLRDVLYPYWFLKNQCVKMWVQFLENYATGQVVGKYPMGNENARIAMESTLSNLINSSKISLPTPPEGTAENYALEFIKQQGVGESAGVFFQFVVDYCEKYSRLYILGEDQSAQTSGDGLGSGRAEALQGIAKTYIDYDTHILEDTLSKQFVEKIIKFNFPYEDPKDYKFSFLKQVEPIEERINKVLTARNIGLQMSEKWVYEMLSIPQPQPDEKLLEVISNDPHADERNLISEIHDEAKINDMENGDDE